MENKNNKIAFITGEYSEGDFTSGGLKLNFELILELLNRGYDVDIFSQKYLLKRGIVNGYYDFKELENIDLKSNYALIISEKGIYPSDVTYIHDHSYAYRAEKINKSWFSKILYNVFACKKHKKRRDNDVCIKQNLDKTSKIIVSSQVLKNDMMKNFAQSEDKLFILPPAIKYDSSALFKSRQKTIIFGLSAIGLKRKGFYEVLNAVKKLRKSNKNFVIKVIYPKFEKNIPLRIYLKLFKIDKYFEFCLQQKNMDKFYSGIDYMLMPSRVEPFGMVATEAMSHFKPALATSCCGACDVIANEKLICESENLHSYMKTLIELSDEEYEFLAKSAYNKVKNMGWGDFCNRYIEILKK